MSFSGFAKAEESLPLPPSSDFAWFGFWHKKALLTQRCDEMWRGGLAFHAYCSILGCRSSKSLTNTAPTTEAASCHDIAALKTWTYWVKSWDTYLFEQSPTKFNATVLRGNYSEDYRTEKLRIIKWPSRKAPAGRDTVVLVPLGQDEEEDRDRPGAPPCLAFTLALGESAAAHWKTPLCTRSPATLPRTLGHMKMKRSCPQTQKSKGSRYQASRPGGYSTVNAAGRGLSLLADWAYSPGSTASRGTFCTSSLPHPVLPWWKEIRGPNSIDFATGSLQKQSEDVLSVTCGFPVQVTEWTLKISSLVLPFCMHLRHPEPGAL